MSLPEKVVVVWEAADYYCGWDTGTVQEPIKKGTSAVGSSYQRTRENASERTNGVL